MRASRTMRWRARMAWLAAVACWLACAAGAAAQGAAQEQKPPPPGEELVEFNPLKAEKNLEVGRYYLRSGNYDAAIDRLKDALKYKSNFAAPHRYLGEAYEKKGRLDDAIKHYKRYLEILPSAEDAKKIQKRIEKLSVRLGSSTIGAAEPPETVDRGDVRYPLEGEVSYTNTGTPISGYAVECFVGGWSKRVAVTVTDSSGKFYFPSLAEGTYHIRASKIGYFTVETIVNTTKKSTNILQLLTEGK